MTRSKRILHWYPNFLGGGSIANVVSALAMAQSHLGAEVAVAATEVTQGTSYGPVKRDLEILQWQPAWTTRFAGLTFRGLSERERQRIKAFRPEVIHVHGDFNPDNFWSQLFDCPVVFSPHGAFHPLALAKGHTILKRLYVQLAKPFFYNRLCAFHASNPLEKAHILRVFPKATVYCAPLGPNVHPISPLEQAGSSPEAAKILYVGRLDVYTKGLDLLLEAFAKALHQADASELLLVGADWNGGRRHLEELAEALGIREQVHFLGVVSNEQLVSLLAQVDVYVQLSRHDGFPLSVVEALLAGKPVILSEGVGVGALPEVRAMPHVRVVPARAEDAALALREVLQQLPLLRSFGLKYQGALNQMLSWEHIAQINLRQYQTLA